MTISWLFLLAALWGAAFTALALWPPRSPSFLLPIWFLAAWLTTELAVWHLLWQVVATIVFVALGALDDWPGRVGLAITVLSWTGLVSALVAASRTGHAFETAFAESLGPEWRDTIDPAWVPSRSGIEWTHMFFGWHYKRRGIRRTRDLPYVDDGLPRHRLDVWRRDGVGPAAPVLLQIPGGGWVVGSKEQQARPLMYLLAECGWVCVAINYRLSPKATWPDHLVDCKRALKWIREHIAEFGGDPGYVVVTGGSAGGHLAAAVGLTANRPEFQPGFEGVDTRVRAMMPFYGAFDFFDRYGFRGSAHSSFRRVAQRHILKAHPEDQPEVFAEASPLDQVHRDAPPALVVHGELDIFAPVQEARMFAKRLSEVSQEPAVYVELEGGQHAFDMFHSIRALHAVAEVGTFLAWLLSRDEKSTDAAIAAAGSQQQEGPP